MSLSESAVSRPITWIMLSIAVGLFGLFGLTRLQLDLLPDIEFPMVAVVTTWTGADPAGVEQLVTRPVEEALELVPGIEEVTSKSQQGSSLVMARFGWGSDMRETEQDIRKQLELSAIDRMPDDAERPLVFAFDPSLAPVMFLTVNAPGTSADVRRMADEEIGPRLARLPGVAAAEVMGGDEREIAVQLQPDWLSALDVSPAQVAGAIRAADAQSPGGRIETGGTELGVVTEAQLVSPEEVAEVVVGSKNGVPIKVRDVADTLDGYAEQTKRVRSNQKPAVLLMVRKQSDANTVQVSRAVRGELALMEEEFPTGVSVGILTDQADPITRSLSNLSSTAMLSLGATALVLLSFLRSWRTSSVVVVSIPFSMLVTFAVMDALGVTLNVISMAGLALAVGMLVDNSIVVVENIFVAMGQGRSLREAAIEGTDEVVTPIVASTLTTLSVFLPVLFVPGLAGQLFRDMALTICISLLASLAVTVTLVPLLASLSFSGHKPMFFERIAGMATFWVEPLANAYGRYAPAVLRRPWLVLAAATLFFVGTMATTPLLGVDFLPPQDRALVELTITTPPGMSLDAMDERYAKVERIVEEAVPEATTTALDFGSTDGIFAIMGGADQGTVRIGLPPLTERTRDQAAIEADLLARLRDVAGIEAEIRTPPIGGSGDVQVRVTLEDIEQLQAYGAALQDALEPLPEVKGTTFDLSAAIPEMKVRIDRDQAQRLGVTAGDVANTLATAYMGFEVARITDGEDEIPVKVRASPASRQDLETLRDLPLLLPTGKVVPLSAVASIGVGLGPTSIPRANQDRAGTLSVSLGDGTLGELITTVERVLTEVPPPAGASVEVAGTAEDLKESFVALGYAVIAAILLVYMVMASQFESLVEPFVILATIPLAAAGAVVGLLFTFTTVQVTALIGVVLLVGIVVNNGILLVDVLKTRRDAGADLVSAAGEAGRSRLRPILMTSATTVLGMLPLALELGEGAELWAPMARAVIGGMVVSTGLTLFVVPAAYIVVARLVDRVASLRRRAPIPEEVAHA